MQQFKILLIVFFVFSFLGCLSQKEERVLIDSMDESLFWEIIDSVRGDGLGNNSGDVLRETLSSYSNDAVATFIRIRFKKEQELYSWSHFSAAWLICGELTPVEFRYFRDWVIFLGKEPFENIAISADYLSLLGLSRFSPSKWETLSTLPRALYKERAGDQSRISSFNEYNIAGHPLSLVEVKRFLPNLYAQFR